MKNKWVVNLYLWKIRWRLQYPKKTKREILQKYRRYIYETMEEDGPIRSKEELYRRFEKPELMAEQYMTMITEEEKYRYGREKLRKITSLSMIILLLALFVFVIYFITLKQGKSYSIEIGDKQKITSIYLDPLPTKGNRNTK